MGQPAAGGCPGPPPPFPTTTGIAHTSVSSYFSKDLRDPPAHFVHAATLLLIPRSRTNGYLCIACKFACRDIALLHISGTGSLCAFGASHYVTTQAIKHLGKKCCRCWVVIRTHTHPGAMYMQHTTNPTSCKSVVRYTGLCIQHVSTHAFR